MALVFEAIALVLIFVSVTRPGHLEKAITSSHAHYITGKTFPGAALSLALCLLQHFVHICIVAAVAAYEDGLALYKGQSIVSKDTPPCVAVPSTTALPASMPAAEPEEETNKVPIQDDRPEKEKTTTTNTANDESCRSTSTSAFHHNNTTSATPNTDVEEENQVLPPLPESDDASLIGTDHTDHTDDAVDDTPLTSAAGSVKEHDEKENSIGGEHPGTEDAMPVTRQPEVQAPRPINQDKQSDDSSTNDDNSNSTEATSAHTTSAKPEATPNPSDTLTTPPSSTESVKDRTAKTDVPRTPEQTQSPSAPVAAIKSAETDEPGNNEDTGKRTLPDTTAQPRTTVDEVHTSHMPEAHQDKQKTPSTADERTASPSPPAKSSRLLSKLRSHHQDDAVSLTSQSTSTHEPQPTMTPSQSLSRVKGKLFRSGTLLGKKKSSASVADLQQQQEQQPAGGPRPSHSISLRFKNSKKRLSSIFH